MKLDDMKKILQKRFDKIEKHYIALKEYKHLIDILLKKIFMKSLFLIPLKRKKKQF